AHLEDRPRHALRGRRASVGRDRGPQLPPPLYYRQHRDGADRRSGGEARVGAGHARRRPPGGAVRRQHRAARHSAVLEPEPEHPSAGTPRPRDRTGGSGRPEARRPERPRRERLQADDPGAAARRAPAPLHGQLVSRRGPEAVLRRSRRPPGRARDGPSAPRRPGAGAGGYGGAVRVTAGLRARNEWKFAGVLLRADRALAVAWWTLLLVRGLLPALFAIAMGGLIGAVQRGGGDALAAPLALVGVVFVLLQVLSPI